MTCFSSVIHSDSCWTLSTKSSLCPGVTKKLQWIKCYWAVRIWPPWLTGIYGTQRMALLPCPSWSSVLPEKKKIVIWELVPVSFMNNEQSNLLKAEIVTRIIPKRIKEVWQHSGKKWYGSHNGQCLCKKRKTLKWRTREKRIEALKMTRISSVLSLFLSTGMHYLSQTAHRDVHL